MAPVGHQGIHQNHLRVGFISIEEHGDFGGAEFLKHVRAQVSLCNELAKGHRLGQGSVSSAEVRHCRQNLFGVNCRHPFLHEPSQNHEADDSNAECARGNDGKSLTGCDPGKHSNALDQTRRTLAQEQPEGVTWRRLHPAVRPSFSQPSHDFAVVVHNLIINDEAPRLGNPPACDFRAEWKISKRRQGCI